MENWRVPADRERKRRNCPGKKYGLRNRPENAWGQENKKKEKNLD